MSKADALNRAPQWVRFLVVGGAAALVNWLVRFPLSQAMPFPVAVAAASVIGMAFGFVGYRKLVFLGSSRTGKGLAAAFVLVNLVSAVLVTLVSTACLQLLDQMFIPAALAEGLSHAVGIAFGAVSNFYGHRKITFVGAPRV
jgi:putative flippase GtrA